MKVVLRNSSVVYEEVQWTAKIKDSTTTRGLLLGSCEELKDKHVFKAKVTILANPYNVQNVSFNFGTGRGEVDPEQITSFLASSIDVSAAVGNTFEYNVDNFTISNSDLTNERYVKAVLSYASTDSSAQLPYIVRITYKIEYIFA
jgi:hypothetical protein